MKNEDLFKTIVAPIDFSKVSANAMWYAAEMAVKQKAKLILLHVYQFPYISPEIPGIITPFDEIEKETVAMLERTRKRLHQELGKRLKVEYAFRFGSIEDEIEKFVKAKKASLVVIGMQGAGYMAERLFGSVASALMRKLECPVLTIGKNVKFKAPKVIALAYDYKPVKKSLLEKLKFFAQAFRSHICVVHVAPDTSMLPGKEHARESARITKILGEKSVTFYYIDHIDLAPGMKSFMTGKKADMIAMFPASHNLFSRFWSEPNSKKIAFRAKVPLLTMHKNGASSKR